MGLREWGPGAARPQMRPMLSEVLAQAGRRYARDLPGPVHFLVWSAAGPSLGHLTPWQVGCVRKTQGLLRQP